MNISKGKNTKENKMQKKVYATNVSFKDKSCEIIIEDVFTRKQGDKEILIDEVAIKSMIKQISEALIRNTTKYNELPTKVVISNRDISENRETENTSKNDSNSKDIKNEEEMMINSYSPKYNFENVCINDKVRNQINTTLNLVKNKDILYKEWGLGESYFSNRAVVLNFYGKPGTGKSMAGEAIANHLNKKVCLVNYSELESKFVGETPKNIKKAFQIAKRDNAVLIFDEADSFLGKRLTSVTQSADYGVNITRSVLLLELEKFDGVVIFTTNLLSNYDDAFKRRILANIMFDMPDENTRAEIWRVHLGEKVPVNEEINCELLSQRYNNITGADIKDIIFYAAINALEKDNTEIDLKEFDYAYDIVKQRYENKLENQNQFKIKEEVISKEQYEEETQMINSGGEY
ncbi:ATP-binding protein [Terrisporobacter petrolearius]|uniref:ATP-binding protein n=1 Tax=Terrisporobacter petrolearius TaxID=1460447 RepID=UPI0031CC82C1